MLIACLLPIVFTVYGLPAFAQSLTILRVNAPIMNGFVDYNKFDTRTNSNTDPPGPGWVPMNTTGSPISGNLYIPFYDLLDDTTVTKAGYRLDLDETSEVVYVLNENYSFPNMSFTAGRGDFTAFGTLITQTQLTYLDAAPAARDIWANGTFIDLPFTSQTAFIGKEMIDNGSVECPKPWNFTATVVTADGTTSVLSAIDNLSIPVPQNTASTITLRNSFDPGFLAVLSFSDGTPFLYSRGSSGRIGDIVLEQTASITFCPEDD
ncbi:hypothetical protein C8R44DRAFT_858216 [Mycena epipterygia]|nr:hypothetical protein C8R44DRAFT_858216 [Mycena epipterygia]